MCQALDPSGDGQNKQITHDVVLLETLEGAVRLDGFFA